MMFFSDHSHFKKQPKVVKVQFVGMIQLSICKFKKKCIPKFMNKGMCVASKLHF